MTMVNISNPELHQRVGSIVFRYFPAGLNPSAQFDRQKFRAIYGEHFNAPCPANDAVSFANIAKAACIEADKLFFWLPNHDCMEKIRHDFSGVYSGRIWISGTRDSKFDIAKQNLLRLFTIMLALPEAGQCNIFFDKFVNMYGDTLSKLEFKDITKIEAVSSRYLPRFVFDKTRLKFKNETLESEINRAIANGVNSLPGLIAKLPFIRTDILEKFWKNIGIPRPDAQACTFPSIEMPSLSKTCPEKLRQAHEFAPDGDPCGSFLAKEPPCASSVAQSEMQAEREPDDDLLTERFNALILKSFKYGFRPRLTADSAKAAADFLEMFGMPLVEGEAALTRLARKACAEVKGIFYGISPEAKAVIDDEISAIRYEGMNTIYFDKLYQDNAGSFTASGLLSADIMAGAIKNRYPNFEFSNDHLRIDKAITLEDEILSFVEGRDKIVLQDVARMLPFIPQDKLKDCMQNCNHLEAISSDNFMYLDSTLFDEEDKEKCLKIVKDQIASEGYCPAKFLWLNRTADNNPDIPKEILVRNFVKLVLRDGYVLRGGIIRKIDAKLRTSALIRNYCLEHSTFRRDELAAYADTLDKRGNIHYLQIAQNTCIQIDEDKFVALDLIDFDIDAIDTALDIVTGKKSSPLRSVSSFALFPAISGYRWNHHLLMSYCLLKSNQYAFVSPAPNNQCVGIICNKKISDSNYYLLAANIALKDNIDININSIENYALSKGLLGRKRVSAVKKLWDAIQTLSVTD